MIELLQQKNSIQHLPVKVPSPCGLFRSRETIIGSSINGVTLGGEWWGRKVREIVTVCNKGGEVVEED